MTETDQRARAFVETGSGVLVEAAHEFQADRCRRLGAGLAYYALFALVPTLLLTAMIAATLVGREAVEGELAGQLDEVVGPDAAAALQDAIAGLWENTDTSSFALISVLVVVYSASILFVAWRDTLEIVWDVPYEANLAITLRARAFGALVPITAGVLLAAVLILEVAVGFVEELVDSVVLDTTLQAAGSLLPAVAAVLALGFLYRYSARSRRPDWQDIWPGTVVAAVLLALASWGFGVYMNVVGSTSVTGAASSVVVALIVVYYAGQIVLFGAEIIKVLHERRENAGSTTA